MEEELSGEWIHAFVWLSPFPIHLNYHNIVNWLYSNTKQQVKMVKKKKKIKGETRWWGKERLVCSHRPFSLQSASFAELLTMLRWYRASRGSQPLRSHREEGPGTSIPFSVENKWRLPAMMTLFFGSGFAPPSFIVRPVCCCPLHRLIVSDSLWLHRL